jgi:hypothetical protein
MSIFLNPAFDPNRPNANTVTAWGVAHGTEGRQDAQVEQLGVGPTDRIWWYQRQPYSRIPLELHGSSTPKTIWSLYLLEAAGGGVIAVANIDTEVATAFTLPDWIRNNEASVLWSLEMDAPLLLQGLKGTWPFSVQLVYERLPGDPEPHWMIAKVLHTSRWSDLVTEEGLKRVLKDEGLYIQWLGQNQAAIAP